MTPQKLFITGIGTNVGKTVVSAVFVEALKADYWKPIQSGVVEGRDTKTVQELISNSVSNIHPEAYLLKEPLSPHYAARLDGITINLNEFKLPITSNHLVIEGAGGILVPLNRNDYVIDIAKQLNLEVVLVVSSYLGCINHSLLSIDYLLSNGYSLKGLILNGAFDEDVEQAIINYKPIKVIAKMPHVEIMTTDFIKEQSLKINL